MLVRNRTAADQTDLCVAVRRMFFAYDRFRKCLFFLSRLHQSFAKAALVKHGISCRPRTEPRSVKYNVVKCPSNETASQFEDTSPKCAGNFLCFVRKAAANMN